MKKIISLFLLTVTLMIFVSVAVAADGKSYALIDDAGLFTATEKTEILEKLEKTSQKTGINIMIYTSSKSQLSYPEKHAEEKYTEEFGLADGYIMYVDMYNRDVCYLNNIDELSIKSSDTILSKTSGYLSDENYVKAAKKYIGMVERDIIGIPLWQRLLIALGIGMFAGTVVTLILAAKNKLKADTTAQQYVDPGSYQLDHRQDIFVSTHTTCVKIETSSGSGGGGGSSGGGGGFKGSSGKF